MTGTGTAVFLIVFFAPALSKVLTSIAFRNRAAGRAEIIRAKRDGRTPRRRRPGKRGRRG
ncbi:hypothetical protein ABT127_07790 [Streptomyces sp. NPDC001904]|uniref:hypothetical protein n=1 Tax=Streptomyces sp. NPDC001904 TaxID=3154531 RepID=UPI00332C28DC